MRKKERKKEKEERERKKGKEREEPTTKITLPGKLYRQAKAKRIQHHQTSSTTNAKGTSLSGKQKKKRDFPGGAVVKNPPANAGDTGSSPGPGRSHMPWSN